MIHNSIPLIPYFETSRYRVTSMVELSGVKKGELVADLGSGDGRIAIEFAKKGAKVTAFEINHSLIDESLENIKKEKVSDNINVLQENFWNADLSLYDIICIYPMPDIMEELEKKLEKELRPGTRILTNYYMFPNWKYLKTLDKVYLYKL